ncbi:MAG: GHMP kinase [Chloroflexi bacterium]|nr:GHMP kinase [Chloroflexota bacterium]
MIISKTPFRLSFAGGGTDLPAFYREEVGAVLSTAIKRYMYVTVHRRFEDDIRVSYSKTETVACVDDLAHELVREAMKLTGTEGPLEVTTIADCPSGTGLGSSSTLTVGLLHALHTAKGRTRNRAELAAEACAIEIDTLGRPIGKQDQYAAAFGGLNYIEFDPSGSVEVSPVLCGEEVLRSLEEHSLLVFTGQRRSASDILRKQSAGTASRMTVLRGMRDLAAEMRDLLVGGKCISRFGALLDQAWSLKRSLGFGISNSELDASYDAARNAGAWGGKLLGAGAGGFLYFLAPPVAHVGILEALAHPKTMPVEFDRVGARIAFVSE